MLVHNMCGLETGYGAYNMWNQGSFDSIIDSLEKHFIRHKGAIWKIGRIVWPRVI